MSRLLRRPLVIAAGGLVALTGLVLMPVPGPGGTPVFLAGLAILATEVQWAKRFLTRFKEAYGRMTKKRRVALTGSMLVFYLVSGVLVWNWTTRPEQANRTETARG